MMRTGICNVWHRLSLNRDAPLTQACRFSPFGQFHRDISIFRIGPISRVHHNGKSTRQLSIHFAVASLSCFQCSYLLCAGYVYPATMVSPFGSQSCLSTRFLNRLASVLAYPPETEYSRIHATVQLIYLTSSVNSTSAASETACTPSASVATHQYFPVSVTVSDALAAGTLTTCLSSLYH